MLLCDKLDPIQPFYGFVSIHLRHNKPDGAAEFTWDGFTIMHNGNHNIIQMSLLHS
ncbi:hypothetical protein D3C71_2154830 [compost metagenome]